MLSNAAAAAFPSGPSQQMMVQQQQQQPRQFWDGVGKDWTEEEQKTLQQQLQQLQQQPPEQRNINSVERCLRIAALLPHKTARDVALRIRWMLTQQDSAATLLPVNRPTRPRSRRKGSRQSSFRISQATKGADSDGEQVSEGDGSCGPRSGHGNALAAMTGCYNPRAASCTEPFVDQQQQWGCGKAGPGSCEQLPVDPSAVISSFLNQNYAILASFKANMMQCKVVENTELLLQYRDNMLAAIESMDAMPGVMSRMPPLPVKPNLEMASRILPPPQPPRLIPASMPPAPGACMAMGGPPCSLGPTGMPMLPPPPPPPPHLHDLPVPFHDMPLPPQPLGMGAAHGSSSMGAALPMAGPSPLPLPHHQASGYPPLPPQPMSAAGGMPPVPTAPASQPPSCGPLPLPQPLQQQQQQQYHPRHMLPMHQLPNGHPHHVGPGADGSWAGGSGFRPPAPPFAHPPHRHSSPQLPFLPAQPVPHPCAQPPEHHSPHHAMLPPPSPHHALPASPIHLPSPAHAPFSPLHAQAPGSPLHGPPSPPLPDCQAGAAAPQLMPLQHPPVQQQQQEQERQPSPQPPGLLGRAMAPPHAPSPALPISQAGHHPQAEPSPPYSLPTFSAPPTLPPPRLAAPHQPSPSPPLAFPQPHAPAAPRSYTGVPGQPTTFPGHNDHHHHHHHPTAYPGSFAHTHAAAAAVVAAGHPPTLRSATPPSGSQPFPPPGRLDAQPPAAVSLRQAPLPEDHLLLATGSVVVGHGVDVAAGPGEGDALAALAHERGAMDQHLQPTGGPSSSLEDYITTPSHASNTCSAGRATAEGSTKGSAEGGGSVGASAEGSGREVSNLGEGAGAAAALSVRASGAAEAEAALSGAEQLPPLLRCNGGCPPGRPGACVAHRLFTHQQRQQQHAALVQQQAQHFLRHDLVLAVPQVQQQAGGLEGHLEDHDPLLMDALCGPLPPHESKPDLPLPREPSGAHAHSEGALPASPHCCGLHEEPANCCGGTHAAFGHGHSAPPSRGGSAAPAVPGGHEGAFGVVTDPLKILESAFP